MEHYECPADLVYESNAGSAWGSIAAMLLLLWLLDAAIGDQMLDEGTLIYRNTSRCYHGLQRACKLSYEGTVTSEQRNRPPPCAIFRDPMGPPFHGKHRIIIQAGNETRNGHP